MNTSTMTQTHESPLPLAPGLLPLVPGQATRLAAAPDARVLWVQQGRVWATRTRRTPVRGQAEDRWLASGETLELPPGSDWVIEPWPAARVGVMLALQSVGASACSPAPV